MQACMMKECTSMLASENNQSVVVRSSNDDWHLYHHLKNVKNIFQ